MQGVGFSHHTTTIITLVVCTVIMLTSEVCTVTVHSVHSRAEKCSSQCAVAASSLKFKLSSVLGARLLTFSLNFRLNPASCFQAGRNKKGLHACNTVVFINCSEFWQNKMFLLLQYADFWWSPMFGVFMCLVQCGDFWCITSVVFGRENYFYSVVVRSTVVWGRVKVAVRCFGECMGRRSSSGRVE